MKFLLDTNIISESIRNNPHSQVKTFLQTTPPDDLYISVLSIGEIRKGVEKLDKTSERQQFLKLWLENDLVKFFSGRILPINLEIANKWGFLLGNSKNPLPAIDSLIAATALCYNLVLVTRNTKDFDSFPIEVINPWFELTREV